MSNKKTKVTVTFGIVTGGNLKRNVNSPKETMEYLYLPPKMENENH